MDTSGIISIAPAVTGQAVDLAPVAELVIQYLVPALGAGLLALATWLARRASAWLGIKISDSDRALLDQATARAIAFAEHQLDGKLAGLPPVQVRGVLAAQALQYVATKAPEAIARLGVTPGDLADRVAASVQQHLTAMDSSAAAVPVGVGAGVGVGAIAPALAPASLADSSGLVPTPATGAKI